QDRQRQPPARIGWRGRFGRIGGHELSFEIGHVGKRHAPAGHKASAGQKATRHAEWLHHCAPRLTFGVSRRPSPDHSRADKEPAMTDYVRKILTSSVYEVAEQTPLERMELLSERLGRNILVKREDLQPVFSF